MYNIPERNTLTYKQSTKVGCFHLMKLLKGTTQFENAILSLAKRNPTYFYVSTFNIKIDNFITMVANILPKNCDKKFLIGVNESMSKSKVAFLKTTLLKYGLSHKITTKHHVKMVVTDNRAIIGSSNLTRSGWEELNVLINNKNEVNQLKRHFRHLYDNAKK